MLVLGSVTPKRYTHFFNPRYPTRVIRRVYQGESFHMYFWPRAGLLGSYSEGMNFWAKNLKTSVKTSCTQLVFHVCWVLFRGKCPKGNPKDSVWEDWGTLGKIRGITTPPGGNPTVDGRNLKQPPGMYKTLINNGINYQAQLVKPPDFSHQQ